MTLRRAFVVGLNKCTGCYACETGIAHGAAFHDNVVEVERA